MSTYIDSNGVVVCCVVGVGGDGGCGGVKEDNDDEDADNAGGDGVADGGVVDEEDSEKPSRLV